MKKIFFLISISLCLMSNIILRDINPITLPTYFPSPEYNFKERPLDTASIELGRILFYDPILSENNTVSCASCHSPYNAFAHTDHELSHGIYDSIGTRNAPALFNLAWHKNFMWDGAINHIEMQALAPISNKKEMGSSINQVIDKLEKLKHYKKLFTQTYGDSSITSSKILKALSQFQLSLVSWNSKYDKVRLKKEKFTAQEENGYKIYLQHCSGCHTEPLFSNFSFETNGLPIDSNLNDLGRFQITQKNADKLKFKVPSLRNLSYTYPYMHDGRFATLNQVIKHYTSEFSTNHTPPRKGIDLTSNERVDLISFLLTLNDIEFVLNKNHQFKKYFE